MADIFLHLNRPFSLTRYNLFNWSSISDSILYNPICLSDSYETNGSEHYHKPWSTLWRVVPSKHMELYMEVWCNLKSQTIGSCISKALGEYAEWARIVEQSSPFLLEKSMKTDRAHRSCAPTARSRMIQVVCGLGEWGVGSLCWQNSPQRYSNPKTALFYCPLPLPPSYTFIYVMFGTH